MLDADDTVGGLFGVIIVGGVLGGVDVAPPLPPPPQAHKSNNTLDTEISFFTLPSDSAPKINRSN